MTEFLLHPDFSQISYPTDRLTVKAMRTGDPDLFAQSDPIEFRDAWNRSAVPAMIRMEREFAQGAFSAAIGHPSPLADERPEVAEMLADCYKEFGLSSGVEHTKQLIRDIEAQATAQARAVGGQGR